MATLTAQRPDVRTLWMGAPAGLLGGIPFGIMMGMLGMLQMIFAIGQMQWMSVPGHILFGEVLALSFLWLYRRAM